LVATSGASNAAYALSRAISEHIPYNLVEMSYQSKARIEGNLTIQKVMCKNPLALLAPVLPRFVYIPLYKSDIPRLIAKGRYDLVHIHNPIPSLAMKRVAKVCLKMGIPYCLSTHGLVEVHNYSKVNGLGRVKKLLAQAAIIRPFEFVVRNASWIFTLSPYDEAILKQMCFPIEKTSCVTNGITDTFFEHVPRHSIDRLERKLGLHDDANRRLLFIGSLHSYKGVDTFLKSLKHIARPVTAVIGGKIKSAKQMNELLPDTAAARSAGHRVIFTGWLSDQQLRDLYRLGDVFVYPTRADTLPLCILEAMASGLPIVSTNVGGIPFQLAEGAGFVAPSGNPDEIAEYVSILLENEDLLANMSVAAKNRAKKVFNWNSSAMLAINGYNSILKNHERIGNG
jgi:glycosyltransferase involved in cell wall biosynthesis